MRITRPVEIETDVRGHGIENGRPSTSISLPGILTTFTVKYVVGRGWLLSESKKVLIAAPVS